MKVNIINLERRPDRKEEMAAECKSKGLDPIFHIAVDGQKEFFKIESKKRMRGHFGCLQSHRNTLRAVKGTADYHIILEDDVILVDDFAESVKNHISILPDDWSMCYFGGHTKTLEGAVEDFDKDFFYARNVLGLYCYAVNDRYIDEILETLEARLWKADMVAIDYQQKRDVYISKKCHAWIRESFSDICHEVINPDLKY